MTDPVELRPFLQNIADGKTLKDLETADLWSKLEDQGYTLGPVQGATRRISRPGETIA